MVWVEIRTVVATVVCIGIVDRIVVAVEDEINVKVVVEAGIWIMVVTTGIPNNKLRDRAMVSDTHEMIRRSNCAMEFWVPKAFFSLRQKDHAGFSCPAKHDLIFPPPKADDPAKMKTRVTELEAEVKQLRMEKTQLIHKLDQKGIET